MPLISEFSGIKIYMYFQDHNPPHIHARYSNFSALLEISQGNMIAGSFPKEIKGKIKKWTVLHKEELMNNWQKAQKGEKLQKIKPLE
ncbi:MAG: DUF4160 domain-containing protein [Bacillota bacterium]